MHELSIAVSIVETVEENLPAADTKVKTVFLKIGKLSGVVKDALTFSFDIATNDSNLAGAKLEIEELAVIVHCRTCDKDLELDDPPIFRCQICKNPTPDIVQGKELEIVSVELTD
jgi:hydrogenase nickel incorporation protein HypA/HybF